MGVITEELFFEKWKQACGLGGLQNALVSTWNSAPDYTRTVLGAVGGGQAGGCSSVVELIKHSLGSEIDLHREYYCADAIYYYKKDNISKKSVWVNHIAVHLEHENVIAKSLEEIAQLQTQPGDLNVLVTYPSFAKDDTEQISRQLKLYVDGINDRFLSCKPCGTLLVIFGYMSASGKSIDWQGYKLSGRNFVRL